MFGVDDSATASPRKRSKGNQNGSKTNKRRRGSSQNWENDRLTRREVQQYKERTKQHSDWPVNTGVSKG